MHQLRAAIQAWRELVSQTREANLELDAAFDGPMFSSLDVPAKLIERVERLRLESGLALAHVVEVLQHSDAAQHLTSSVKRRPLEADEKNVDQLFCSDYG